MKTRYGTLLIGLVGATTAGLFAPVARGQTSPASQPPIITGFPASENVTPGPVAQRSPGRMVQAGVARSQAAIDLAGRADNIQEVQALIPPRTAFMVSAIKALFTALDQALPFFEDLLLRRAGLPPSTTDGTTGGTTGNTGGTTGSGKPRSFR